MVNRSGSSNQVFRKKTNSSCKVPPLFFIWLMLTISIFFFWSGRCGTITGKPLEEVFHQTLGLGIRTEQIPEDRHGLFEVFQLEVFGLQETENQFCNSQSKMTSAVSRTGPDHSRGVEEQDFCFLSKRFMWKIVEFQVMLHLRFYPWRISTLQEGRCLILRRKS